jgi:predicted CoA-binding protein
VVMVAADRSAGIVRQALERHVPRVWLHKGLGAGALSEEAVALCRGAGIEVVEGACPLMFLEPVRGIHHLHARLARRRLAA